MASTLPSQIPDSLLERIAGILNSHSAPLLKLKREPGRPAAPPIQIGSGTFVAVGNTCGILTAQHVARELEGDCALGLALDRHEHIWHIERCYLDRIDVAAAAIPAEGPDLAFIALPSPRLGWIKAIKSFYNLSYDREEILRNPVAVDSRAWFICGTPGLKVTHEESETGFAGATSLAGMCYATVLNRHYVSGDYDYIEVDVQYGGETAALETFGGMSGGGLWQVQLTRPAGYESEPSRFLLSGVVFFQSPIQDDHRFIRCHGPRSIYDQVYNAVKAKYP